MMSTINQNQIKFLKTDWISLFIASILGICLSVGLAWISTDFNGINGWLSFLAVIILSAGILLGLWGLIRHENPPCWLLFLIIAAVILRLSVGVFWSIALPIWGHGTPAEQAGYVMADASSRDQAAWDLAQSGKPLFKAFRNNRTVDQYGGMLFLSAFVYRFLGSDQHYPLLIIVLCAALSSSAILLTWAFAQRAWNKKVAAIAALILTFYPEAVLLGSSQMREAFMIPLTIASFYGLICYQQDKNWRSVIWILIPLLLFIPFSPPFAALLMGFLILAALLTSSPLTSDILKKRFLWLIFCLLMLLILAGLWITLKQFTPEGMYNPFEMASWWLRKSASYQAYLSKHASGWMQAIFKNTPEWTHLPMLLAYGTVQPFLPAAIVVGSHAPIWRWISVWRAAGWTLLLVFLIYAPLKSVRSKKDNRLIRILLLIIWGVIFIAAFRGGSDMWDNPRYRATFAGLQVSLVAWIWVEQYKTHDPWLRRAVIGITATLTWFLPWYFQRYYSIGWPITDPFKTLGLGICTGFLFITWDWARTSHINNRDRGDSYTP